MNMKILSTEKHYDEALFSDDNMDAGDQEDAVSGGQPRTRVMSPSGASRHDAGFDAQSLLPNFNE